MTISLVVGVYMCAASCCAATIASSSIGNTDCAPIALPSLVCMNNGGDHFLSLQSSDDGAIMMLMPAVILSECAGPSPARKISSCAWLLFYMIHLYICGSCRMAAGLQRPACSIPGWP